MRQARVAIVDPYSSGALLAQELVRRNITCAAIESSSVLPPAMRSKFDPALFDLTWLHETLGDSLERLRQFGATHVIAGFESGVELAEQLADHLGLPTNDPSFAAARRDKHLMTRAVAEAGLRTARHFSSNQIEALVEWTRVSLEWPVIVKPTRSVASDLVFKCTQLAQVREAAASVLSTVNVLGVPNESAMVQEYLDGPEYAVDFVCLAGKAKLTAIWQYDRPADVDEFVAYDSMTLLDYRGERQAELRAYAQDVLNALGVRFGPAHCEIIWHQGEPVLVEVGARMSAGINSVVSGLCGGTSQLNETVDTLVNPAAFLAAADDVPTTNRHAITIFLRSPRPGKLKSTHFIDQLRQLPNLHSMSIATEPGSELASVAGRVTLIGEDRESIDQDVTTIRRFERFGIFELC